MKILFGKKLKKAQRQAVYSGPMSVADITLSSWNEFFREGGELNRPAWLQGDRLKELKKQFTFLARYHSKL